VNAIAGSYARWRARVGLRARATAAFALGAMLVSTLLAVVTYQLVRSRFIEQRIDQAVARAQTNAAEVESSVTGAGLARYAIDQLGLSNRAYTVAVNDIGTTCGVDSPDQTSSCSVVTTIEEPVSEVEQELRLAVVEGRTAYVVERIDGVPTVVVGVPLYGTTGEMVAEYFERVPLPSEAQYLNDLAQALAVAALIASLLGAGFGRLVSVRIMRPLRQVAKAAREITSGELGARIDVAPDSDLDPLVGSFNSMADSLQQRIEREARFASDVSHELRTPLTSLSAGAQLLASRRDDVAERTQPVIDVLVSQTEHFRQLVLDLLEISRFDAGAAEMNVTDVDLPEFIAQVAETYGVIPIDSTRLARRVVRLDRRRVERILANLLQNAQNYAGGATGIVVTSLLGEGGKPVVRIAVDDAGNGISEEERAVIFERFRRGSAQRQANTKGTGLGLSLVSEHARLHGGRVWAEDSPAGGARFVVELVESIRSDGPALDLDTVDARDTADAPPVTVLPAGSSGQGTPG
jgi:two-component system, OmpR family, sensor histidine kinase MtrB